MFFWLLILLVTILFYWFTRIYINPGNFPNFPGKLPVIGHLHKLPGSTKELWDLVRQIADSGLKTGNVILFYFGFFPVYDSLYKPFIYHLLENENKKLSLEDIRDEIKVMIMTGYETSNTVILFVLLLVGTYPHVQQKIFEELEEVFEDSDRDVTKADLTKLVYIDAVLKETSRYCPAVPVIGRVLHEDVQLKNSVLKKGNVGIIMLYAAMRHPMWGPDADQWIPERWLDPQRIPANPHAFAAFSYGKRNCIVTILFYWLSCIYFNPGDFPTYPGELPLIGHLHLLPRNSIELWNLIKQIADAGLKIGNVILSHRKLLNPSFNQKVLDGFMNEFNEQSKVLVKELENAVGNTPKDHRSSFERNSHYKPIIYHLLENENKTLSLEEIKDEINVIILTGFETSTNLIIFVLLLVGTYPHVQQKIFEELEEVFGDLDRDVTKADLSKLVYIDAVLKETSRYVPVVPLIGRVSTEDFYI
ncbi:unnamed protein product [Leptidea sinapis]|uniref:Cytochrome P450 n=1 Tax=Leptidea sinapis TaxID=189913 RepID=A0A5E4QMU7_9NEOP|nr:unnamed protein product [Leptidea sinapis]